MAKKYYNKYSYTKKRKITKFEMEIISWMVFLFFVFFLFYIIVMVLGYTISFLFKTGVIQLGLFGFILYYGFQNRYKIKFMFKSKDEQYKFLIVLLKKVKRLNFQKVRDEEGLEDQLMIHLEHLGYNVSRQEVRKGKKIDLVVDQVYAIELKLFEGKTSELQRLSGQIEDYLESFKYVGIVIFTTENYNNTELDRYLKRYNSKQNVYAVKVLGNVKRIKNKTKYVILK